MAERGNFRLPQRAREYFKTGHGGLETLFDAYYLCALTGMMAQRLGVESNLEPSPFVVGYPTIFHSSRQLIAAFLVDTEMRRQAITREDRSRIQSLIRYLTATNDQLLSDEGISTLNLYAAGGFDLIRDKTPPTSDTATMLVSLVELLQGTSADV